MHVGIVDKDDEAETTTEVTTEETRSTTTEENIAPDPTVTEPFIEVIPVDEIGDADEIERIIDGANHTSLTEATLNDLLNDTYAEKIPYDIEDDTVVETVTNVTSNGMVAATMINHPTGNHVRETMTNSTQRVVGRSNLRNDAQQEHVTESIEDGNTGTLTIDGNTTESVADRSISSNDTETNAVDNLMDSENMTRPMEKAVANATTRFFGHGTIGGPMGHERILNDRRETDELYSNGTSRDSEERDTEKAAATTTTEDTATTTISMEDSEYVNDVENEYVPIDNYEDMTETTTIAPDTIDQEANPDISEEANEVDRIMDGLGSQSSMSAVTTARYDSLIFFLCNMNSKPTLNVTDLHVFCETPGLCVMGGHPVHFLRLIQCLIREIHCPVRKLICISTWSTPADVRFNSYNLFEINKSLIND